MRCLALLILLVASFRAIAAPTLQFGDTTWHARSSQGGAVEYTPEGQEDLERFGEMLTFHPVPADLRPEDLEAFTRDTVERHERRGAQIFSSECEPATRVHVADCTIMLAFPRAEHVEIGVTKHLAIRAGLVAISMVHREYGDGAAERTKAWIKSPEGARLMAAFIDWVDAMGLRMDAEMPARGASGGEEARDVARIQQAPLP